MWLPHYCRYVMSEPMSEDEAVEMMQENYVGLRLEVPKQMSDATMAYETTAARVRDGVPQLQRVPLDHNGQRAPMNKEWITLEQFMDKVFETEEWGATEA